MKTILDVCYSQEQNQYLDIHLPESESFSVFLYFHGGGLTGGSKAGANHFAEYLTAHGIAVVSANYRMYPQAKYPDFLEDSAEAVAWVMENKKQYGKVKKIYVGGSSAGGYITQMLCFDRRWLAKYGISPMDIAGFVHDAGQPTCHFNVLKERGIDSRRIVVDESAPLYHIGADSEYPPMLVIVSDNDIQNRYEQTVLLMSTLKHFELDKGVQMKLMNAKHCGYIKAFEENGDNVFGKLIWEFIQKTEC